MEMHPWHSVTILQGASSFWRLGQGGQGLFSFLGAAGSCCSPDVLLMAGHHHLPEMI